MLINLTVLMAINYSERNNHTLLIGDKRLLLKEIQTEPEKKYLEDLFNPLVEQ